MAVEQSGDIPWCERKREHFDNKKGTANFLISSLLTHLMIYIHIFSWNQKLITHILHILYCIKLIKNALTLSDSKSLMPLSPL